uniref:SLC41A/MgtE integral membrane domain-containing protein n=1 Tax=Chromera velia CCMP2878 TaxID=1169474 RepID=A0A0G4HK72_9ALVE|eukprot:Cvel_28368.t1-p1 / transcript=Cvel_28368.t1 / gene=Cvel_28368 / organism=Chromera_velia_CCMP2878 / gene_product=Magnesium transporter MgtE, putative / transcript_product=Magnesium transporter MgtE, putative / location=Cvel_scaffold3698:2078-6531(+) / protein_length=541 / sequence_SO=supercontig / SO=protein_coding / is_pseudo=false
MFVFSAGVPVVSRSKGFLPRNRASRGDGEEKETYRGRLLTRERSCVGGGVSSCRAATSPHGPALFSFLNTLTAIPRHRLKPLSRLRATSTVRTASNASELMNIQTVEDMSEAEVGGKKLRWALIPYGGYYQDAEDCLVGCKPKEGEKALMFILPSNGALVTVSDLRSLVRTVGRQREEEEERRRAASGETGGSPPLIFDRFFATDERRRYLGLVTAGDLLTGDESEALQGHLRRGEVIEVSENLERACLRLTRKNAAFAPLLDSRGSLMGVLSPLDVLRERETEFTDDMLRYEGIFFDPPRIQEMKERERERERERRGDREGSSEISSEGSGKDVSALSPTADALGEWGEMGESAEGGGMLSTYWKTPITYHVKSRASWLVALLGLQSLSSIILAHFQDVVQRHIVIALFLTMLTGTAGNAGNQSSATVIRGLATGEVTDQNAMEVVGREVRIAAIVGLMLSAASFVRVFVSGGSLGASAVVASAMGLTTVGAVLLGTVVPIVLARFGLDPCTCASPALATITDVLGVYVLCSLANSVLTG